MRTYDVTLWWSKSKTYSVEADGEVEAIEKAEAELLDEECPDDITDNEVQITGDYLDQNELEDRERDLERKEDGDEPIIP